MTYRLLFVLTLLAAPVYAQSVSSVTAERAGWGTFGVVLPQGASAGPLQVGTLPTQTDVKVKWPDGSIRHAVVTAKFPAAGTLPITQGGASGTAVADAPAVCSAEIVLDGSTNEARPISQSTMGWLLVASQVRDRRWLVTFGSHPSLRLRLDERRYADGVVRCDFSIENSLNVPETKLETYDIRLKHGATVVYERTAVTHGSFTRWRYVHWQGGQDAHVIPDLESFHAARALPRYRTITRQNRTMPAPNASGTAWRNPDTGPIDPSTGKVINWDILNLGPVFFPMLGYGGRSDIGPYPDWTAQFITFKGAAERAFMLRTAELAGAWTNHITEPATDRAPTVDLKPEFWLLRHNIRPTDGTNGPANDQRGICAEFTYDWKTCSYRPETGNAHQPSFAYVPYLVTGDRFFADEMRAWAHDAIITWNPMLDGDAFNLNDPQDEIRSLAWGLRDMVDAAVYLPDGDIDKGYFRKVADTTLVSLAKDAAAPDVTGLGAIMIGRGAIPNHMAPTTQLFLAWSLAHAADQGFPLSPAFARLVQPLITLILAPESDFPLRYVPSYRRWVLRKDGTSFKKPDGSPDLAALWRYNFAGCTAPGLGDTSCPDPVDGHDVYGMQPWFGYHAAEVYPALMAAAERQIPGAKAAFDEWMAYTEVAPWGETLTMDWELKRRSQWAIAPFGAVVTPPPTACADGADNDKDGKIDLADPGCSSASDTDEADPIVVPPPAICADGLDNDKDGKVDYPADPGCSSATDTDEADPPPVVVKPKVLWSQTLVSSPALVVSCVDMGDGSARYVWRLGSSSVVVETAVCR